jgi:hypothetical protein
MLRPLINLNPSTFAARPAIVVEGARASQGLPHRLHAGHALPTVRGANHEKNNQEQAVRPELVCVYCGHPLYAPPKAVQVRCPVCIREIPVVDLTLRGDVQKADAIVTAGKITVAVGARVAAELVACTVEIGGKVLGDVLASQACRVRCTAKVSGRIICRHLTLEPGAQVEGMMETVR